MLVALGCAEEKPTPCEQSSTLKGCGDAADPTVVAAFDNPPSPNTSFADPASLQLTVDDREIFFTSPSGELYRALKTGGEPMRLARAPEPSNPGDRCFVTALSNDDSTVFEGVSCGPSSARCFAIPDPCSTEARIIAIDKRTSNAATVFSSDGRVDDVLVMGGAVFASIASREGTAIMAIRGGVLARVPERTLSILRAFGDEIVWAKTRGIERPGGAIDMQTEVHLVSATQGASQPPTLSYRNNRWLHSIAVAGQALYAAESRAADDPDSQGQPAIVTRHDRGSPEETVLASGSEAPAILASDGASIFGGGARAITKGTEGGTSWDRHVWLGEGFPDVVDMTLDASHVYWVDYVNTCTRWIEEPNCSPNACARSCSLYQMRTRVVRAPR